MSCMERIIYGESKYAVNTYDLLPSVHPRFQRYQIVGIVVDRSRDIRASPMTENTVFRSHVLLNTPLMASFLKTTVLIIGLFICRYGTTAGSTYDLKNY